MFIKTVILTGGGTAGHVIPSLALLPELKKRNVNAVFIGGDGMEKDLVPASGIPFHSVSVVKFDRKNPFNNLKIPAKLIKGTVEAEEIFGFVKPDVVFAKGGYASLPACFAAKKLSVPVIVHESDYSFGLANMIIKKFAAATLTSFPETGGKCVGNPVRREILCGNKYRAKTIYPVNPNKKTVLIFGGSSGATKINETVYSGLDELTKKYNIIHIAGKNGDFTKKSKDYFQIRYASDIADLFALCDAAVSRGGANALSELAALNKPSVIIPLPKGTSRGDQLDNAKSYKKRGYFEILPQNELTAESLLAAISNAKINDNPTSYAADAIKLIVDEIEKYC